MALWPCMCMFQHPPWRKAFTFLRPAFQKDIFSCPCSMMWRLLNCQFKCLTAWLCGFDSVYSGAVDVWTIFKHWLFDFPPKSWVGTWSLIIVVEAENLSKLELFNFNFGKKIRSRNRVCVKCKQKRKGRYFTIWHLNQVRVKKKCQKLQIVSISKEWVQ